MIEPHGGLLVNRILDEEKKNEILDRIEHLGRMTLNAREVSDLEMIATGAMSPLTGFMIKEVYDSVVMSMHMPNGLPWTLPVCLAVKPGSNSPKEGEEVALIEESGEILGVIHVASVYRVDKLKEAEMTLKTTDDAHPGVQYLRTLGAHYVGGEISLIQRPRYTDFLEDRRDPDQTRALFQERGWNTVVAFQTRNPIHRAHEYLQKVALEIVDGLLIHPLMGATKSDDVPADVRMACYKTLIEGYYPKDRVLLSVFPAAMRYAGPREAIFHALLRKNYGCTHFIVGRDHAGVGNYYGTYEAQHIFREFDPAKLNITPLFFEHAFYCTACEGMATTKTCPHGKESHVFLSGTKVREMLRNGDLPPEAFTRPEVAKILANSMKG